jgi:hypothetical protein
MPQTKKEPMNKTSTTTTKHPTTTNYPTTTKHPTTKHPKNKNRGQTMSKKIINPPQHGTDQFNDLHGQFWRRGVTALFVRQGELRKDRKEDGDAPQTVQDIPYLKISKIETNVNLDPTRPCIHT